MYDVTCLGGAIVDTLLSLHDANVHCRLDTASCELCIKYGEKIPLDSAVTQLGGNACNVSVGLTRLGLKTGLMAEIGTDVFAEYILHTLQHEQVDTSLIQQVAGASSLAIGINFQKERTLLVKHVERKHDFHPDTVDTRWIYLTSLGKKWEHVYDRVADTVVNKKYSLACNPGTLQLAAGKDVLQKILSLTDVLLVSMDEARSFLGAANDTDSKQLLSMLHRLCPKLVVLTDGERGSYAIDGKGTIYTQPIVQAAVVERTGAGDAYATGFLAALIHGRDIQTAMTWGTINAASVIGQIGAQPGLLTKEQLEEKRV